MVRRHFSKTANLKHGLFISCNEDIFLVYTLSTAFMHTVDLISRRINTLIKLTEKKYGIFLTDLRKEYRADLQNFIVGETLRVKDGKVVIGINTYKRWLQKFKTSGFVYDVLFV